jgi:hypothetical protein
MYPENYLVARVLQALKNPGFFHDDGVAMTSVSLVRVMVFSGHGVN